MNASPWPQAWDKAQKMAQKKGLAPVAMLTAYDYPTAKLLDEAGADCLLVGDSLGMVVMGYPDTTRVTLADMIHHTGMVARAHPEALVIADMPINTYRTELEAITSATALMQAGADSVKLEGGCDVAPRIQALTGAGIPVVGHIGLLPQRVKEEGGYKIKGKTPEEALQLKKDIQAVAAAGACLIVIEGTAAPLAKELTELSSVPTIGIGSGKKTCDGAVVVISDLVGAFPWFVPAFVQPKAHIAQTIKECAQEWIDDIKNTCS